MTATAASHVRGVTTAAPRSVPASSPPTPMPPFRQYRRPADSSNNGHILRPRLQAKLQTRPHTHPTNIFSTAKGALDLTESRPQLYLILTVLTAGWLDKKGRGVQGLAFETQKRHKLEMLCSLSLSLCVLLV